MRLALVLLPLIFACRGPVCDDDVEAAQFVAACEASGGLLGYCQCGWEVLAENHSCRSINTGDLPDYVLTDACRVCSGGCP